MQDTPTESTSGINRNEPVESDPSQSSGMATESPNLQHERAEADLSSKLAVILRD